MASSPEAHAWINENLFLTLRNFALMPRRQDFQTRIDGNGSVVLLPFGIPVLLWTFLKLRFAKHFGLHQTLKAFSFVLVIEEETEGARPLPNIHLHFFQHFHWKIPAGIRTLT